MLLRDGNDGPWSSFRMQVGTSSQNIRLIPSSSGNTLWVVLPQGCVAEDPGNCANLRGSLFYPNESSTWSDIGLHELGLLEESLLGYSGNADVRYDTVTLGWQGDRSPTLNHQVIQGIATKDFYIGTIGFTSYAVNITSFNDPQPSMLEMLRIEERIISSS